ncbi:MAG: LysE family translocator [Pseudomonadota bacterium]
MFADALPPAHLIWTFLAAGLALNVTPGADMMFVAASAGRSKARSGVAAAYGVFAGCLGHMVLAAFGVAALVATSQTLFTILKAAGAAYLFWLALQMLRKPISASRKNETTEPPSMAKAFRGGMLVNLLNPKVGLFFISFLPQFIDPNANVTAQILLLGLLFNITGLIVNIIVAMTTARAGAHFRRLPYVGVAARWIAATLLGGLAIRLVFTRNA